MECKYCGIEFSKVKIDEGTFAEGYCSKLHRKDHEKQLIKEGKMEGIEIHTDFAVMKDSNYRDRNGERIWFPKDGRPYYDRTLKRTFNSIQEKHAHMKEKGYAMHGSADPVRRPLEAGDMRNKSYRKLHRMED